MNWGRYDAADAAPLCANGRPYLRICAWAWVLYSSGRVLYLSGARHATT
jgi:hypothetical protein